MKFLCCLLLAFISAIPCEGQTIFNAHQISGNRENYIYLHAMDPLGNKYLNIYTKGGEPLTIYGKSYNMDAGLYILRFDANDSLTFIYDIWGLGLGNVQALTADKNGNLYIAGLASYDHVGYFAYTKLGMDGKILWQVRSSIGSSVEVRQILIDNHGNSYVAGTVESAIFFGVSLYKSIVYPAHDFLLKISPTGILTWMHTSDASDNNVIVSAMRFDNEGNIILGGSFHTEIKIGSASLTNPLGANYSNMYIRCISPSGDLQWLKGFTGPGNFYMLDIEVDSGGNFYFSGRFHGDMTFGDIQLSTRPWRDPGFIMGKLSNNFDVEWIKYNDSNNTSSGGYLANTSDGVLISGAANGVFQIDNLTLPASNNYQAFIAKVLADGTTSWLKGYGEALTPGWADGPFYYYFYPGYQLSRITDQCYFISGNFVNTLNTNDGLVTTQSRAVFTGIFAESLEPTNVNLGPDISASLCHVDTCTISLNSILGTNYFSVVQGLMPTVTFIDNSKVKLSNLAYGVTKFKWIVQNCTSVSSKLITINRVDSTVVRELSSTKFCKSQLDNALITVSGANVKWYDDESLTNQLNDGNTFVPTVPNTVYVTNGVEGCISKPSQIIISVIDNPQPPTGETPQTLTVGETIADLIVSGNDVQWYASSGNELPLTAPLENESTYFATQTVSGCESEPLPVKVSVITAVENYDTSLSYYPNPVKDNLIISFNRPMNQVVVKNILGQTVIANEVNSNTIELRLTSFQSGIYFIQIASREKLMSFKIAKE